MEFSAQELHRRKEVWPLLSELFLDCEIADREHRYVARGIRALGLAAEDVEQILYVEVYPLLIQNLVTPVGEWAGWDKDWLGNAIVDNMSRAQDFSHLSQHRPLMERDWIAVKNYLEKPETLA